MAEPDTLDNVKIAAYGIILSVIIFFFVILAVVIVPSYEQKFQEVKVHEGYRAELAKTRAPNEARTNGYKWIDKSKGKVQIDIERAKQLVLRELAEPAPAEPTPDTE